MMLGSLQRSCTRSISTSVSSLKTMSGPNASMFSLSWVMEVAPMMVLET